jgi:TatD DNase family protein
LNFVDTHCHLHLIHEKMGLASSVQGIIQAAKAENVNKLLTVSGSLDDLQRVVTIVEEFPHVFGALGVHPHDASKMQEGHFEFIKNHLQHPKISMLGEIGLDYYYEYSPRDIQKEIFLRYLKLAIDHEKPVVLHTRDAENDTVEILKKYGANLKGVVHCFTGSLELAQFILKECPNLFLGFTGVITFKNAQKIREVVQATPIERIFIETDSPFMAPEPFRGKTNQPSYIPYVLKKVAEIKGLAEIDVLNITNRNSEFLFQE